MDELTTLRNNIDKLDDQLFELLEQRFTLSEKVKHVKHHSKIDVFDLAREETILHRIPNFPHQKEIQHLYQTIFSLSKAIQEKKN